MIINTNNMVYLLTAKLNLRQMTLNRPKFIAIMKINSSIWNQFRLEEMLQIGEYIMEKRGKR